MNVSSFAIDFSNHSLSSFPRILVRYYIDYLWNYSPTSYVAKVANLCRVLAFLLIFPLIVVALLDISSYAIARTLGVIEDVKASTSDKATVHRTNGRPLKPKIFIHPASTPASATFPSGLMRDANSSQHPLSPSEPESPLASSAPPEYFTSESVNLKLSGFGVFSPAPSQPPSPTITRRRLNPEIEAFTPISQDDEGLFLRKKKRRGGDNT